MKYIIFNEKVVLQGYYEECIWDEHPDMGSYRRNISKTMEKEDVAAVKPDGRIVEYGHEYGSSLFGSLSILFADVDELLNNGSIYIIDENIYMEWQAYKEEWRENYLETWKIEEIIREEVEMSSDLVEELSKRLLETAMTEVSLLTRRAELQLSM